MRLSNALRRRDCLRVWKGPGMSSIDSIRERECFHLSTASYCSLQRTLLIATTWNAFRFQSRLPKLSPNARRELCSTGEIRLPSALRRHLQAAYPSGCRRADGIPVRSPREKRGSFRRVVPTSLRHEQNRCSMLRSDRQGQWVGARDQSLLYPDPTHSCIDISRHWGPLLARTRAATEAFYLFASYVFDSPGYTRLGGRSSNMNIKSKNSARRFGFTFEGVTRRPRFIWRGYSMLRDVEWPL